ncbi:MAG: triphosphoribosyl-dephospho-CoA synthase [Fuerstiella sp.]|nr:triphosphoribosyl-dephospho-CoA synthase [Fuerstiella sp.]
MSNDGSSSQLSCWIYQACLVEVLSEKPGNVSPRHRFRDSTVNDFIRSAQVSAPILARSTSCNVGRTIYDAAVATRHSAGHNTNLGILLLLAPMAAVPAAVSVSEGIDGILAGLTVEDADWAYRAIRLAQPGGLGQSAAQDVHEPPSETLLQCMERAADRDLIALQYSNGFHEVLGVGLELLIDSFSCVDDQYRIGWLALKLIAEYGDSLIARKVGQSVAADVQQRASAVIGAGWPDTAGSCQMYNELDTYLRSNGNQLNPGTTADMIAAIIYAGLQSRCYSIPAELLHQINFEEQM